MSLREEKSSILLVFASESMCEAVKAFLPAHLYAPIRSVSDIAAAKRAYAECAYDIVIIHAPFADEAGLRFAIELCETTASAVLLTVNARHYENAYGKACGHGVFVLATPVPRSVMTAALAFLRSLRARLCMAERKVLSLEEKTAELHLVNRAKWLLIDRMHLSEEEAHRYIEKTAMDLCITKREAAGAILAKFSP